MQEKKKFFPKTIIEWFTFIVLVYTITGGLYSYVSKYSDAINKLNTQIIVIKKDISNINNNIKWIRVRLK